jgi:hypothetical protein
MLLHYQHVGYGARGVRIGRLDLLDPSHLGPSVMLELRAAVPDRADIKVFLAEIDGGLCSWPLQKDVRPVTPAQARLSAKAQARSSASRARRSRAAAYMSRFRATSRVVISPASRRARAAP